ncbi:MAG: EF-hand domain-containing protein [Bacteroidetes bacterium]|nr:EF-hand domain-containing protein [Bacteroidota bacterium]
MRPPFLFMLLLPVTVLAASCSSSEPDRPPEGDPQAFFIRMDKDGDGRISWDEFRDMPSRRGAPEDRFQRMDKDSDGYVTLEEFLSAREEFRGKGGNMPNRRGGARF